MQRRTSQQPLFTFVHVTDTHWNRGDPGDGMLRRFVEAINDERFFPLPDFLIHTGDIIRGYYDTLVEHYDKMRGAKEILDRLKPPAYFTCHNHDTVREEVRGVVFDEVFGSPHLQEIERDGFYLLILSGALASSTIYADPDEGGPPPGGGHDFHTPKGKALLRSRLGAHAGSRKLLFSHCGLVTPRGPTIPEDPALPLPRKSGFGYCWDEERAAGVRRILSEHGVIAHYCGNSHVNSRAQVGGVQYISTSALHQYPGEARHVTVYEDRLVNRIIPVPGGRGMPFRWPNVSDAEHPTGEVYMAGNPHEREFTIEIA